VSTPQHSRTDWGAVLALESAISALVVLIVVFIWGVATAGYFWPMWVIFALAIPIVVQLAVRFALRAPAGRYRALALVGAGVGSLTFVYLSIYALSGGGYFWPVWPMASMGLAFGTYAIVVFSLPRLRPRERELEARVSELTRTRMGALDVQASELRRIERDLHDGAQSRLVALSMQLGRAEERLEGQPEIAEFVRRAREEAGNAIAELRDLARGIAPPVLADRGLAAAAEALGRRAPMPVTVDVELSSRPLPVVETAAYFVVAESLTNAAKHAGGAAAHVDLAERDDRLVIEVWDEGPGGADPEGTGLTGLRHRVEALDGSLTVSAAAGGGTRVHAELPCGW
jgi:signal transduction histidine kinase